MTDERRHDLRRADDRETYRMLGVLEAEVKMLKELIKERDDHYEEYLKSIETKVNELTAFKNKGLGILLAIGAVGSVIGAMFSFMLEWQHWGK